MRLLVLVSALIVGSAMAAHTVYAANDDMTGTSKPLLEQAESAMAMCANIWTIKSHDALDAEGTRIKDLLERKENNVKTDIEVYPARLQSAEEKVATAKKNLEARVGQIVEDSAKSGTPVDFTNASQIAKANPSDDSAKALRTAEAELDYLKKANSYNKAWFAALPALRTMVEDCLKDQRSYLGPRTAGAPSAPPTKVDDTAPAAGATRVSGSWQGGCFDEARTRTEHAGKVTLDISPEEAKAPAEGQVSGNFDIDGTPVTVEGTWYKNLNGISATGSLGDKSWGLTGRLENAGGRFSVKGDIAGYIAGGSCLGNFEAK